MSSQEKIEPCPFCGDKDVEVVNTHTPSYWVECHGCGAQAHGKSFRYTDKQHKDFHSKPLPRPYVLARESAIAAWNRRAPSEREKAREAVIEAAAELATKLRNMALLPDSVYAIDTKLCAAVDALAALGDA